MLDSVVFPKDFFVSINELPENEQLKTYKAIFNYCFLDKEPSEPLTGTAKIIYTMSKPQIVAKKQKRSRKETNDVLSKPNFHFHSKTDHNRIKPISFRTGQQLHIQPVLNPDCANGKQKFLRYNRDCTLRTSSFCKHRSISGSIFQIESHCSPGGFDQQIMQLFFLSVATEFDFLMLTTPYRMRSKSHIRIQ